MFKNRGQAGQLLADKLKEFRNNNQAVVWAIPRGGVIVAKQISVILSLPLNIIIVKKLSAPGNPELAIGAITHNGIKYVDRELALRLGVEQDYLNQETERKKKEVEEREKKFQLSVFSNQLSDRKIIILVDDGVATGATVLAAIKYINQNKVTTKDQRPKTILAVPVIAKNSYNELKSQIDSIIALEVPESFSAVGQFYQEFPQVEDEEVAKLLAKL